MLQIKDAINKTAESILSKRRGKRKETWISPETWKLIDESREFKARKVQMLIEDRSAEDNKTEYKAKDTVNMTDRSDLMTELQQQNKQQM